MLLSISVFQLSIIKSCFHDLCIFHRITSGVYLPFFGLARFDLIFLCKGCCSISSEVLQWSSPPSLVAIPCADRLQAKIISVYDLQVIWLNFTLFAIGRGLQFSIFSSPLIKSKHEQIPSSG